MLTIAQSLPPIPLSLACFIAATLLAPLAGMLPTILSARVGGGK